MVSQRSLAGLRHVPVRPSQLRAGQRYSRTKGEDHWRCVREDYAKEPPKPPVDGEPSYEGIPQGLHDTAQPYWNAANARRCALVLDDTAVVAN